MSTIVDAPDDCWAWMLAMNESVDVYNQRLGREIGSVDAAIKAMSELIHRYHSGNQPQLNTASYVESILAHYKTVYEYYHFIDLLWRHEELGWYYYQEFRAWFNLINASYALMGYYTYVSAGYSALPSDINCTFNSWTTKRTEELDVELEIIYWSDRFTPFDSNCKRISVKKFDRLLRYFKTRTREDVNAEYLSDQDKIEEGDYEYADRRVGSKYDFDKIASMLAYYEGALSEWRNARENITLRLPKERQKSYREITRQMHTRLYYDLLDLKEIRF